ncbi:MAG TPA: hypothetical protein VF059_03720, partial [Casimicrobiaceae bacterium]
RRYVDVVRGRDARTRHVAITHEGMSALRAAEPLWMRAQREVARRLGAARLDALIRTLGELELLHPATTPPPSAEARPRATRAGTRSTGDLR